MAAELSQDAVLLFLQSSGGSVKNSELLLHFSHFIRNNADRDRNRELFKRFVNTVATVRQEDGVSHVVLRKKFRGQVPAGTRGAGAGGGGGGGGGGSPAPPRLPAVRSTDPSPENSDLRAATARKPASPGVTVLPAAGIIFNNNNTGVDFNQKQKQQVTRSPEPRGGTTAAPEKIQVSEPHVPHKCTSVGQQSLCFGPIPGTTVEVPAVREHGGTKQKQEVHAVREHGGTRLLQDVPAVREHGGTRLLQEVPAVREHGGTRLLQEVPAVREHGGTRLLQEVPAVREHGGTRLLQEVPAVREHGGTRLLQDVPAVREHGGTRLLQDVPAVREHGGTRLLQDVPAVREHGGTRVLQQMIVPQNLQSREASAPPKGSPLQKSPPQSVAPRRFRYRQSYKTAVSQDEDEEEEEEEVTVRRGSAGGVWPSMVPLEEARRTISVSSPCVIESPAPASVTSSSSSSSDRMLPKIFIQDVEAETRHPRDPASSFESVGQVYVSEESVSSRHRRPSETECYTSSPHPHHDVHQEIRFSQAPGVQLEPRALHSQEPRLSSSHGSIFSPSADAGFSSSDWPPSSSSRGSMWNSSYEDLQAPEGGTTILEALHRAQRTKSVSDLTRSKPTAGHHHGNQTLTTQQSELHHSADRLHDNQDSPLRVLPWHLSTGDLHDNHEEAESSEGSLFSSPRHLHPVVTRRLNSQTRSRMCRSLGANLDQLLQEEEARGEGGGSEAARLNRLHLLSSSLSLRYTLSSSSLSSCSTPPRCQSLSNLVEGVDRGGGGGGGASLPTATPTTQHHEGTSRQSLVPLEPREHDWLVKGASGAWPDIYSLFREEPSLLNKQDFISGFTVLHWIAKHGDHRVLNTLWYGVQKSGLMFDVNARSMCGHTPLHIAAIHGNKNIMRLLVSKFEADVKLRDLAGKRPWQYLSSAAPLEVFQLLGAPARAALGGVKRVDSSWDQQQQQHRRRRRHHFSSASSGERPLTIAGTIRVKRSSSIAALLKHKSLRRFHGHKTEFSV